MIQIVVHLWTACIDRPRGQVARLERLLSEDEQARAGRYRFTFHRDRFVAGRAIRRLILARYLDRPPEAIRISTGVHGKPFVDGEPKDGLRFNDSDSDRLAVVAVTWGREIGVDIERVESNPNADRVVETFGSSSECELYREMPASERVLAFHRWWTAKEAWLKAVGTGLSIPLNTFTVSFSADRHLHLLDVEGDLSAAKRWTIEALSPAPGFVGTLVVDGPLGGLIHRHWTGLQA